MKNLLFILCLAFFFFSCEENRVPKEINVKKVKLTQFPAYFPSPTGLFPQPWESDGTFPDFSFSAVENTTTSVGVSSTIYEVRNPTNPAVWDLPIKMLPNATYSFLFFEDDSQGSIPFIDFEFTYKAGDDYPNTMRATANSCTMELEVEYKF